METLLIPRPKAINLFKQLSHTTKTDEFDVLGLLLAMVTGDLELNASTPLGKRMAESFRFFDDVGMLD